LFSLLHHQKWSVAEFENLYPFERDLYVGMLIDALQKESEG